MDDDLVDIILQAAEEVILSGEEIPDEVVQIITQIIMDSIHQTGSAQAEIGQVPQADYPSSNIFGFNYNPYNQELKVKFMGKDVANAGPVYSYQGVPKFLFEVLKRGAVGPKTSGSNKWHTWKKGVTPSHGAAMYALVKEGGFPYRRIS